jgi:hypothetical protein
MALLRLLNVEPCLVRGGGACVLHRLETLSLRFSMALWTKPPMPLVGDAGRSGDILPCVGDMASARAASAASAAALCSDGGANFCESSIGSGDRVLETDSASPADTDVLAENRLLSTAPPSVEPRRDPAGLERMLSGGGLLMSGSMVDSRDMPGSCLFPEMEPASEAVSSWLRRYAAEPAPLSGVCLNHEGSLAPSEAAIDVREGGRSGEAGSGVFVGDTGADRSGDLEAMESGRRKLPDCGRWFHERVPERPNAAALAAGFLGSVSSRAMGAGALVRRCSDSSRALSCGGGLIRGAGMLAALSCTLRGVPAAERSDCGVVGLSGEMERARSVCVCISIVSSATQGPRQQQQQMVRRRLLLLLLLPDDYSPARRASRSLRP